ncbi:hypothetical protein TNCV_4724021 [Trichonephila clavipes]|uniref:Uncharacterized protein n=1 Tax=Trichonephila clavipes TaxID=2585209 RepID=A0A8X6W6W4_TRICX|nr:hypothetical protein TNCV_4724021 [Trichonephila clavipes]
MIYLLYKSALAPYDSRFGTHGLSTIFSDSCSPSQGTSDRADSYSLYPSGTNDNDLEMANLPTDMELEQADTQRNSTRTPSPLPQLTPCEQLKYNKAQLAKMETFRRCKQACIDALMMMPDHYPEEPFYVRALTELQDVEETMALAVSDIDFFEPCNIPGCPHHEKPPQSSPLKMTQSTPKINPNINYSGKKKDNSNFEYPPQRKTARKIILDITDNEELNLSPNKFALPQGAQLKNFENSGPVANGNTTPYPPVK